MNKPNDNNSNEIKCTIRNNNNPKSKQLIGHQLVMLTNHEDS